MEFKLPSFDIVVELHDKLVLAVSGGRKGLPHPDAIHSAVGRPMRYMHYDGNCTIHTVCAVLIDSLARNHAFADGNKRTALITTLYTYILNGTELSYTWIMNEEYEKLVLWVVEDKPSVPKIAEKLEELAEKYKQSLLGKIKGLITD